MLAIPEYKQWNKPLVFAFDKTNIHFFRWSSRQLREIEREIGINFDVFWHWVQNDKDFQCLFVEPGYLKINSDSEATNRAAVKIHFTQLRQTVNRFFAETKTERFQLNQTDKFYEIYE